MTGPSCPRETYLTPVCLRADLAPRPASPGPRTATPQSPPRTAISASRPPPRRTLRNVSRARPWVVEKDSGAIEDCGYKLRRIRRQTVVALDLPPCSGRVLSPVPLKHRRGTPRGDLGVPYPNMRRPRSATNEQRGVHAVPLCV